MKRSLLKEGTIRIEEYRDEVKKRNQRGGRKRSRARICERLWRPGIDFANLCSLAGQYRTGPPGWKSIPGLLKRSTNTGSGKQNELLKEEGCEKIV